MKQLLSIIAAAFLLSLAACQGERAAGEKASDAIPQTLKVGIVPGPPVSQMDARTGEPKGMAVDLVKAFAERSALKVSFVSVDWANMGAALQGGRVDVVAGPIFQTEARAKEFAFSPPLWSYGIIAVKRRDSTVVGDRNDLLSKPLRISVGRGGFDSEFAARMMKSATITVIPPEQPDGSMLEVLAGRADVALVDRATAGRFLKSHSELALIDEGRPISLQLASFMMRRRDSALRDLVEVGLRNLAVSGEMDALAKPYESEQAWDGLPLASEYSPRSNGQ